MFDPTHKHEFYLDFDSHPIVLGADEYKIVETRVVVVYRGISVSQDVLKFKHLVERT